MQFNSKRSHITPQRRIHSPPGMQIVHSDGSNLANGALRFFANMDNTNNNGDLFETCLYLPVMNRQEDKEEPRGGGQLVKGKEEAAIISQQPLELPLLWKPGRIEQTRKKKKTKKTKSILSTILKWDDNKNKDITDDYGVVSVDEYLARFPSLQLSRSRLWDSTNRQSKGKGVVKYSSTNYSSYSTKTTSTSTKTTKMVTTESSYSATGDEERIQSQLPSSSSSLSSLSSPPRILYITQGEIGHAIPKQANVIVSDRATTCHILIVRSTSSSFSNNNNDNNNTVPSPPQVPPLVSCAHLDGPNYDVDLRDLFHHHYQHHHRHNTTQHRNGPLENNNNNNNDDDDDNNINNNNINNKERGAIQVDLHILGGFLDEQGYSQELSNWLLYQLADLTAQYRNVMHCTLQTCVISSMNHDHHHDHHHTEILTTPSTTTGTTTRTTTTGTTTFPQTSRNIGIPSPWGRGLACDLVTGHVFLAWCDWSVMGPDPILRQSRLWCCSSTDATTTTTTTNNNNNNNNNKAASNGSMVASSSSSFSSSSLSTSSQPSLMNIGLITVHNETENVFVIPPFAIQNSTISISYLLSLSNTELLTMTSTSPECEEDDYCDSIRNALSLIQTFQHRQHKQQQHSTNNIKNNQNQNLVDDNDDDTWWFGPNHNCARKYQRNDNDQWVLIIPKFNHHSLSLS